MGDGHCWNLATRNFSREQLQLTQSYEAVPEKLKVMKRILDHLVIDFLNNQIMDLFFNSLWNYVYKMDQGYDIQRLVNKRFMSRHWVYWVQFITFFKMRPNYVY